MSMSTCPVLVLPSQLLQHMRASDLSIYDVDDLSSKKPAETGIVLGRVVKKYQPERTHVTVMFRSLDLPDTGLTDTTNVGALAVCGKARCVEIYGSDFERITKGVTDGKVIAFSGFEYVESNHTSSPRKKTRSTAKTKQSKSDAGGNGILRLDLDGERCYLKVVSQKHAKARPENAASLQAGSPAAAGPSGNQLVNVTLDLDHHDHRRSPAPVGEYAYDCLEGLAALSATDAVYTFGMIDSFSLVDSRSLRLLLVDNCVQGSENAVPVIITMQDRAKGLPSIRKERDIIRIHRARMGADRLGRTCIDAEIGRAGCHIAVFDGQHGGSMLPYYHSSPSYSLNGYQKQKIQRLRARGMIARPLEGTSPVAPLLTNTKYLSEIEVKGKGSYFDLVAQVLRVASTTDKAIVRVWDGTRPKFITCAANHVLPGSQDGDVVTTSKWSVIQRTRLERMVMENEHGVDVFVYDEFSRPAAALMPGAYVAFVNLHMFIPKNADATTLPAVSMHHGGERFSRRIEPLPDNSPLVIPMIKRMGQLLSNWNYGEEDDRIDSQVYTVSSSQQDGTLIDVGTSSPRSDVAQGPSRSPELTSTADSSFHTCDQFDSSPQDGPQSNTGVAITDSNLLSQVLGNLEDASQLPVVELLDVMTKDQTTPKTGKQLQILVKDSSLELQSSSQELSPIAADSNIVRTVDSQAPFPHLPLDDQQEQSSSSTVAGRISNAQPRTSSPLIEKPYRAKTSRSVLAAKKRRYAALKNLPTMYRKFKYLAVSAPSAAADRTPSKAGPQKSKPLKKRAVAEKEPLPMNPFGLLSYHCLVCGLLHPVLLAQELNHDETGRLQCPGCETPLGKMTLYFEITASMIDENSGADAEAEKSKLIFWDASAEAALNTTATDLVKMIQARDLPAVNRVLSSLDAMVSSRKRKPVDLDVAWLADAQHEGGLMVYAVNANL